MIPLYIKDRRSRGLFPYQRYLSLQERLRQQRRENLLICEHPPTITAGIQSRPEHLLTSPELLSEQKIEYIPIGRGGDHTAHEPGQEIFYVHLDLQKREIAISEFIRAVFSVTEDSLRRVWGIETHEKREAPGLYTAKEEKLVSLGFMIRSGFSSFGLALNLSNDLSTFRHIVPCGRGDLPPTTVARLGKDPEGREEFRTHWTGSFRRWLEHRSLPLSVSN